MAEAVTLEQAVLLGLIRPIDACVPMFEEGERSVVWVDRHARTVGVTDNWDLNETDAGAWDDFTHRYCGPYAPPDGYRPGDIVRRVR